LFKPTFSNVVILTEDNMKALLLTSVGVLGSWLNCDKNNVSASDEVTQLKFLNESMEQQLIALYAQQASHGTGSTLSLEVVKSLEDQLVELYREKEFSSNPSSEINNSLEAQLISLYSEREAFSGSQSNLQEMLNSMERQLVSLYDDRAAGQSSPDHASEMITSLEDQVRAYIDERHDAEKELQTLKEDRLKSLSTLRSIAKMSMELAF